jgi:ABC-type Fe3+/spermidine/putrescine transport system ATPase subunit
MDEPLSNLDAKMREQMRFEIKDLQSQLGITTLYVTHDQEEALALSERMAVLEKGKLHQVGTPTEIYEEPATEFVAGFIGLANFLKGVSKGLDDQGNAKVTIENLGELTLKHSGEIESDEKLLILVRPNDVQVLDPEQTKPESNVFQGVIEKTSYLGEKVDYRIKLDDDLIMRAQMSREKRWNVGDSVNIYLPCNSCKIIQEKSTRDF